MRPVPLYLYVDKCVLIFLTWAVNGMYVYCIIIYLLPSEFNKQLINNT